MIIPILFIVAGILWLVVLFNKPLPTETNIDVENDIPIRNEIHKGEW